MNEQAAIDSKGWNKAQEVMNLAEKSGWKMLLTPYRTYVTLEMTRGVESIEISWLDKGTLMATRHYVSATRNTRSFSFAEALRIIAAVPAAEVKVEAPSLPVTTATNFIPGRVVVDGKGTPKLLTGDALAKADVPPATVGKLCKHKPSLRGHRAKWRKGR